ncbi:MAG: HlyD family efflux transporter periplasmic adaptor subunit [Planctomycetota bacterium]
MIFNLSLMVAVSASGTLLAQQFEDGSVQSRYGGHLQNQNFNSLPFALKGTNRKRSATSRTDGNAFLPQTSTASKLTTSKVATALTPAIQVQENQFSRPAVSDPDSTTKQLPPYVDLQQCNIVFIDNIKLPAQEIGVIENMNVKEGDFIPAGSVVATIDDEIYRQLVSEAQLRYEIASETAADSSGLMAAKKKYKVASIEADKTQRLAARGSKSESEAMMAVYTEDIAKLELDKAVMESAKAKKEKMMAELALRQAQSRLNRHVLKVGFDAYVIKIQKKPQEYVNVGDEVMQVARMDKLWVTGTVDTSKVDAFEMLNRPVTITVSLARGKVKTYPGKIAHVALTRQARNLYMVKAEIDNEPINGHWVLQPNMVVDMRIHFDQP